MSKKHDKVGIIKIKKVFDILHILFYFSREEILLLPYEPKKFEKIFLSEIVKKWLKGVKIVSHT